jgi:hypothetical protein
VPVIESGWWNKFDENQERKRRKGGRRDVQRRDRHPLLEWIRLFVATGDEGFVHGRNLARELDRVRANEVEGGVTVETTARKVL